MPGLLVVLSDDTNKQDDRAIQIYALSDLKLESWYDFCVLVLLASFCELNMDALQSYL